MKRRFLTFISLTVATLLPLLAPSCSGLATPSAPDAPESSDSQRYTLSGSFTMPNSDAAPAEVTNATPSARNAVPDMSSLIYTVEAVRSDGHTETTTSEDHSTYTFTNLTAGSWQITAYAKTSIGTCVMQSETKSVTLSKSKPDANTSLVMEPASGSGDINLTITWDSNSGIGYCKWSSSDYSALTGSPANPNGSVTIDLRGLSARTYSLNLSFYSSKENEEAGLPPVYKCMEYITVYPDLTTNKWTARTASHIDASGNFKVTSSCVETFVYRQIYVSSSGNDTSGNGTIEKPFATIEKAMTRLTEVATKGIRSGEISAANPWELHVSGTITATELSNEEAVIYVDANIAHLAIIGEGSGATIDADDLGTILYIGGDANVSMENVTLKNGNSSKGGGVYIDAGKFTMESGTITSNTATDSGGGVYVATGSEFVMNGGTISSNTATYKGGGIYSNQGSLTISNGTITSNIISSPRGSGDDGGIGIYTDGGSLTMTGGEISANNKTNNAQTASYIRGGGIRLAGGTQFQMSGGKITNNQIRGLGANIFTQSAQIELSGTAEISYGKIDNSDVSFNADAHGAAIWLEGSGTSLTMTGGEIFGNIAKTKDTKNASAGIYVNFATFTMTGGRIYNNEVQGGNNKGGAFRLGGDTNNGAIKISGSASIPGGVNGVTGAGKNDVYLHDGKTITITDALTASAPVATITPEIYPAIGVTKQVLSGTPAQLSANYEKFAVTPQIVGSEWSITSGGILNKITAADFTTASSIEAYYDSMTMDDSFSASSLASMEDKTLLAWMDYNDTDGETTIYAAITFSQISGTRFHMTFNVYKDGTSIANIDDDYDLNDFDLDDGVYITPDGDIYEGEDVGGEGIIYIEGDAPYAVYSGFYGENGYYLIE
ncbi:MAG: hypothetical protein J6Y30_14005 [Treponema sp.]|nr:hypothetical protein [Treponema sp.]